MVGILMELGMKTKKQKCDCGEPASFFYSKCCNAHFEGVVTEEGVKEIHCEVCGKYVATLAE